MLLTIKTLDQKTFRVDFDVSRTVWDLKAHLFTVPEIGVAPELQQLIYAGRVLENANVLRSYEIDERKFLVVMAKKAPPTTLPVKGQTNPTSETQKSTASTKTGAGEGTDNAANKSSGEGASGGTGGGASVATTSNPPPTLTGSGAATTTTAGTRNTVSSQAIAAAAAAAAESATAAALNQPRHNILEALDVNPTAAASEAMVNQIMGMGYGEFEVRRALMASFNNPDRAIEYLIEGIPDLSENTPLQAGNPLGDMGLNLGSGGGGGGGGNTTGRGDGSAGEVNPLHFLRDDPRFMQMRRVVRQRPELLSSVLARIGETNPALLDIIREHQNEFVTMLNEEEQPAPPDDAPQESSETRDVLLTEEDNNAVDRLVALGFPRQLVLQAYIACERNEEQTADFLCRHMED